MRYKNPPLVEATCEFRFTTDSPWDMTIPGLFYETIKHEFPDRTQGTAVQGRLRQTAEVVENELETIERIRFSRTDKSAVVQLSPHVLGVSHLKPYPGWAPFRKLIEGAFESYLKVAQPKGFRRIGLRYIDIFEGLPDSFNLEDYFAFYPFIGDQLPQEHGPFLCGVTFAYADGRDQLRLQIGTVRRREADEIRIQLDMDYSLIQPDRLAFNEVQGWLASAHQAAEVAFEGAITERTRALFGGAAE